MALEAVNWSIHVEGGILVVRDIRTDGDHRVAFAPGQHIDVGTVNPAGSLNPEQAAPAQLHNFGDWIDVGPAGSLNPEQAAPAQLHIFGDWIDVGTVNPAGSLNPEQAAPAQLHNFGDWSINEEGDALVFRDNSSPSNFRYAFWPGSYVNYGEEPSTPAEETGPAQTILAGHRWSIVVERKVLVLRDTLATGDSRIAFYPGCGNAVNA